MEKTPVSTYVLIGINLVAYGWLALQQHSLMLDSGLDSLAILHAGANFNPFTLGGQPWRIITSMFLHYGIIHLAVNMYALYSLGKLLEPALGTTRFLLVYFFCGIAAGLASLIFNVFVPSAGASGALFGLFGYQLGAEVIGNFHDKQRLKNVFVNFIVFLAINGFIATRVNVDTAGHIGGFVGGALLAVLHFKLRWFIPEKFLAILPLLLAGTLFLLPKDQVGYYRIFQRVVDAEGRTNEFFKITKTSTELADSLSAILPVWDSISLSLKSLKKIPEQVQGDTAILRSYIHLRRQEAFYKVVHIRRESYIYFDSLEIVNKKFEELPSLKYLLNYNVKDIEQASQDTVSSDNPMSPPVASFRDTMN